MPPLPEDQRLLLDGLLARLGTLPDQGALIRFVAEALRGLLRRQGDSDFREAIETAFVEGVVLHPWSEQKALAAEVLRVVIAKRPEIARAWQAAHAAPGAAAPARRASDQPTTSTAGPAAATPPTADDPFAAAERALGRILADMTRQRLEEFAVPPARMPSAAYHLGPPFFLFDPAFAEVLGAFVGGPLLRACRDGMERQVYRASGGQTLLDDADWAAFIADRRERVWGTLTDRLRRLAEAQPRAEAKQAAAEQGLPVEPGFRVIEKRVTRPRVFSVLGVPFTLGQTTTIRRVKIRLPAPHALDADERTALDLLAALRQAAEQGGIDLPEAADLVLLSHLFGCDRRAFATARDTLVGLMGHASTSGPFLVERLQTVETTLAPAVVDLLGVMLFTRFGHARFGLTELQSYCQGMARDPVAGPPPRPFCCQELASRPRALVVQFREAMRRRAHADTVAASVEWLLACWQGLGRQGLADELAEGMALFDSFAPLFADDPDRAALTELTELVRGELTAPSLGRASLLLAVGRIYDPVARRAAGRH